MARLELDHLGLEVGTLASAVDFLSLLFGYQRVTDPVVNTHHGVEVVFLEKKGSLPLKLFHLLSSPRTSGIKLHHICFRTDDIQAAIDSMVAAGARLLDPPTPGEAFNDEPIAFLFVGGLNIELVSTREWRGRIVESPNCRNGALESS